MKTKLIIVVLCIAILASGMPYRAFASSNVYTDIPKDHWSWDSVNAATEYGLMQGVGEGLFGFGKEMSKAEFITVLYKMFEWELINPEVSSFNDVENNMWFYKYTKTALKHKVIDKAQNFYPNTPITREEMAVMLVRALGYKALAESVASFGQPFNDVTENIGYIAIASDIGMTKGIGSGMFAPKFTARREEAAAMLVRVYKKLNSKTDWVHGFYAFSSYSQKELAKDMDAVSLGWSRMSFKSDKGVFLNTTSADGNEWNIPQSYELATGYFKDNSVKTNLSVYMDTSTRVTMADGKETNMCNAILLDDVNRTQSVKAIKEELSKPYKTIGYNPYNGVTIDFEGMRGIELNKGFSLFLTELKEALKSMNKDLYVAVHPVNPDGNYFDAYDYRTIGQLADKVILMAHDFNGKTMPQNLLGSQYYKNTALTPFASVYYALKAITDENKGVQDTKKIALAISFSSVGWKLKDSKLIDTSSVSLAPSTIYEKLKGVAKDQTAMGYSDIYRNPYINYLAEDGTGIFLWYEDERSVTDKIQLAKLFGINGVSLWRIGNIPNYSDEGLYYNVWKSIKH